MSVARQGVSGTRTPSVVPNKAVKKTVKKVTVNKPSSTPAKPKTTFKPAKTILAPNPVKKPTNKPSAPKMPPPVPGIDGYLGTDSTYQNTLRGQKRTLADYLSDLSRRKSEAGTTFKTTKSSMERDRTQQLADLKDEYASRGLLQSGIFAGEQSDFQNQYSEQANSLEQQQASLLADYLSQETNYKRESDLALEVAKQEALKRRAAKFNIGA